MNIGLGAAFGENVGIAVRQSVYRYMICDINTNILGKCSAENKPMFQRRYEVCNVNTGRSRTNLERM